VLTRQLTKLEDHDPLFDVAISDAVLSVDGVKNFEVGPLNGLVSGNLIVKRKQIKLDQFS
jgi:hypothetical protein